MLIRKAIQGLSAALISSLTLTASVLSGIAMNRIGHVLILILCFVSVASAQELHDAADQGQLDKVKSLLAKGIDLNSRNDFDMTPLHLAAYKGHEDLVAFLLDKGAQIDAQNKNGYTPLMLAIYGGHPNVARTLVTHGANVNVNADTLDTPFACLKRDTALSTAWDKRDRETVRWLISIGADVNIELEPVKGDIRCQGSGKTLFHKVVASKDYDMIKLFLEHGVDVHKKLHVYDPFTRHSGWIGPLEMSRDNKEITDLLRSYAAKQPPTRNNQ